MPARKHPAESHIKLNPVGTLVLEEMRNAPEPHRLFGHPAAECEALVSAILDPLLAGAPLALSAKYKTRWFLSETVRLFRTRTGFELAMHVEAMLQKWHAFGLNDDLMQLLVRQVWQRVKFEPAAA
jgi:hypothetical protein